LRFEDWAAHRHPARGCVYEEAALLSHLKRTVPEQWPNLDATSLEMEVTRYRQLGYPGGLGNLTANGMIIRRHSPHVAAVNETWWLNFAAGCGRDQLSFPVAAWARSLKVNRLQHHLDIYASPLVKFGWHAAWKDKPDNVVYRSQRERTAARVARLREVVGDGGYEWKEYK
jgi:hypothetical protein